MPARRSCPTRSRSRPRTISSTGSRTRRAIFSPALVFPERTTRFEVTVDLVADMAVINPFDFFLEPEAENFPFTYDPALAEELAPFRKTEPVGPLLKAWLSKVDRKTAAHRRFPGRTEPRLQQGHLGYIVRLEPGVQTPRGDAGRSASGSCRDSAWLLVQILRHLGFAARFVSGYLIQLAPDDEAARRPGRPDARLHRSACLGRSLPAGRRLDRPRSDVGPARPARATSRSPARPSRRAPRRSTAASTKAEVQFEHEMSVRRVRETPRVTKPYTDEQWQKLLERSARQIERDIAKADVRLTMGGEPTFVSIDDMDGAEWNTAGAGPGQAAAGRPAVPPARRPLRHRRRCCISARANGIPASSCRAGRWPATGARTAQPIWRDPASGRRSRPSRRAPRPRRADRFAARLRRAAAARSRLPASRP